MTRSVVVVSAGLRSPSSTKLLADDLGQQVITRLGDARLTQVELREYAHEITDATLTGFPTGELLRVLEEIAAAVALVVVTPTFSGSYSGLFKAFFDLVDADTLAGTPVLLAATGGTERHSLMLEHAMRPLFTYLGAAPVRTGVFAATSDFGGEGSAQLADRIARAATELAAAVQSRAPGAFTDADAAGIRAFHDLLTDSAHSADLSGTSSS